MIWSDQHRKNIVKAKRLKSGWKGDICKVEGCGRRATTKGLCDKHYQREYYKEYKIRKEGYYCRNRSQILVNVRSNYLKRAFKIDDSEYERLLKEQDGKCVGCGSIKPGGRRKHFQVDHDHSKKQGEEGYVRGLLCWSCNVGLGILGDSEKRLEGLIKYLRRKNRGEVII